MPQNSPDNPSNDEVEQANLEPDQQTKKNLLGEQSSFQGDILGDQVQTSSVPRSLQVDKDPSEYSSYTGTNINPFTSNLERERAEQQGFGEQLGKFGIQLGAEVLGGSIEGAGYILDLPSMVTEKISGEQIQLGTKLSELGRNIREGSKEKLPIYEEDPGSFNPMDSGWWFKNGVSIASTLSLAIPAYGATRGVAAAGRGIGNLGRMLGGMDKAKKGELLTRMLAGGSDSLGDIKKASELASKISGGASTISTAAFSRHAENLMEAMPLFEEQYQKFKDAGLPEDVARQKAGEAAATSYKANSLFLLQDIGTFGLLGKASRGMRGKGEGIGWGESILEMGTEGVEEAYQYGVEKEAEHLSDVSAGIKDPSQFSDRLGGYMNGEMATGAFFGALGSGVFRAIGSRFHAWNRAKTEQREMQQALDKERQRKGRELTDQERQETESKVAKRQARERSTTTAGSLNANQFISDRVIEEQEQGGDPAGVVGVNVIQSAVNLYAQRHRTDPDAQEGAGVLDTLDAYEKMSEEEFNQEFDGNPPFSKDDLNQYKQVVKNIPQWYDSNRAKYDMATAQAITRNRAYTEYGKLRNENRQTKIKEQIQSEQTYNDLTKKGKDMVDRKLRIEGLKKAESIQREIGNEESADWIQERREKEEERLNRQTSKERKTEDDLNDESLMESLQPQIEALSGEYANIAITNSKMAANRDRIHKLQNEYKKKQEQREKQQEEQEETEDADEETPSGVPTQIDPEDKITTQIDNTSELDVGDKFVFGSYPDTQFEVVEKDDNGEPIFVNSAGDKVPVSRLARITTVHKVAEPADAQRDAKADAEETETQEFDKKIPDDYESGPPKKKTEFEPDESQAAAWMSIHNERNQSKEDPDEIARSNWAETHESLTTPQGPKYEVHYELEDEGVTADEGAIRAYVVDKRTGERVIENDKEVFFYVHEPEFGKRDTHSASEESIRRYRQKILNTIDQGETPVAPVNHKSEGNFRWRGDIKSVKEATDNQNPTLAILNIDREYSDRNGFPVEFERVPKGNPDQIGRVYTVVPALNGNPKALPLERATLDQDLASTVASIVNDIINGAALGENISESTASRLKGEKGEAIKKFANSEHGTPTNKELLDLIVLEGGITNKMKKPNEKRFVVDVTTNTIRYGNNDMSFQEWSNNIENKSNELIDFLKGRRVNILREHLNKSSYNDAIMDSQILYSTNELPLLIHPTIKFGEVHSQKDTVEETMEDAGIVTGVTIVGDQRFLVNAAGDEIQITNVDTGEAVDPSTKKGREILAEAPKAVLNNIEEGVPWETEEDVEPTQEGEISDMEAVMDELIGLGDAYKALEGGYIPEEDGLSRDEFLELNTLTDEARAIHDHFINKDDSIVQDWITGKAVPDPQTIEKVKSEIRGFWAERVEDVEDEGAGEEEEGPADPDDVDDAMGDLLQREPASVKTTALKPVLEGLKRKMGIPYIMVNAPDANWAGVYDQGHIFINTDKAGDDTPFHEYAHPIIRQIKENSPILYTSLMQEIKSDPKYKEIYQKVRGNYPEYNSDQVIEEAIVQVIGEKASMKPTTQSAITRLWNKIKDYIKSLFSEVNVSNLDESTTLNDIADLLRGQQFINVQQNPMAMYQKVDENMTYSENNSWINSMMFILLRTSEVSDYTEAHQLDFESLRKRMSAIANSSPAAQKILDDMYKDEIINRESDWYKAVRDKLSKFNIVPEQSLEDETYDDETHYGYNPDYMFSGKDKASSFVKMIFSTVPKLERQQDGSTKFVYNQYTGMPQFRSFNDMWNLTNRILADTVESFDQDGNIEDIFDKFISKMSRDSDLRPEIDHIVKQLKDAPDWKRSKFVSTFYQANQNYSMMIYDGKFKLQKNEPTAAEVKVENKWREQLDRNWFNAEGDISSKRQNQIEKKFRRFEEAWAEDYREEKATDQIDQKWRDSYISILSDIGLDLDGRSLEYLIRNKAKEVGSRRMAFNQMIRREGLNRLITTGSKSITSLQNNEGDTFIEDQQFARDLIQAQANFSQDLGTASVFGPNNNNYYNYSNTSMMGKLLQYYKENPREIEALENLPFYRNSKWKDHIETMYITNNMSFKMQNRLGQKMQNLSAVDRVLVDINKALQGQYSMMARGANATEFNIAGVPIEKAFASVGGNIELSHNAIDDIANYVYDEFERIRHTRDYIDANKDNPENLVEGYHIGAQAGLQLFLMPEIVKELDLPRPTSNKRQISRGNFVNRDEVRDYIKTRFAERVMDVKRYLRDHGLSDENQNDSITPADGSRYREVNNKLDAKLYDYVFNGMVANIEQQKLFAADTAAFGKSGDNVINSTVANMQKRILANGSMGKSWYIHGGESETYNSAVINDAVYDSKVYDNYKGVEVTDAQAWVTFDFYIQALKGYGMWGPEHDSAEQRIRDGSYTRADLNLLTKPLKTVHFERVVQDDMGGTVIPVYDKQTILPLVPPMVENTSLQNLLDNMEKQGIDHVTVSSGKKLGRRAPTDAIDSESLEFKDSFDLNPIRQSKRYTFHQTPMPAKGRGSLLQGSQQKFNILTDLDPDFTIDGKNAIALVHDIQGAISDVSAQNFDNEITTDNILDLTKLGNKLIELTTGTSVNHNIADYLEKGLPIEAIPAHNFSLQNTIMSKITDTGAAIDFSNGFRGVQASVTGFKKLTADQKGDITWLSESDDLRPPELKDGTLHKGEVLIPHSLIDEYNLNPTNPTDKAIIRELVSGFMYRIPNQAPSNIAPFEIAGVLPPYMEDTVVPYGELIDQMGADNDGDKLDLMMYNYVGDSYPQKIQYWSDSVGEQTLQEIWDYRTEVLGENLQPKEEFVNEYMDKNPLRAQSKQMLENYLIDTYMEIMSNKEAFDRMKDPLETDRLEVLIKEHERYEAQNIEDLQYASPFFQAQVRDSFINANSGVGQDSNHTLDHVKSQNKDIFVTTGKGEPTSVRGVKTNTVEKQSSDGETVDATIFDEVENANGERISKIISMFFTAHVDAENDDYAPRGNFNTETNSVALTMVRAGVPLERIVDIIGSQQVRDYTRYKMMQKNQLVETDVDPLKQTLLDHGFVNEEGDPDMSSFHSSDRNPLRIYTDFESVSADLSKSIQMTRFSTRGGGASFASAVAYKKFINEDVDNLSIKDEQGDLKKFNEHGSPSMEEKYYENTVLRAERLFDQQSIAFGGSFHRILDHLTETTKFEPINLISGDTSATEDVYFDFYAYVMSGAFDSSNRENFIRGDNTVAQRIRDYEDQENPLVQFLIPTRIGKTDVLQTSNATRVDEDVANQLQEGWEDIYQTDPDLALDLARYAYFQSGFKRNLHSFHEYIPYSISRELGLIERFNELKTEDAFDGFVEQYIRHNMDNNDLVPRVKPTKGKEKAYVIKYGNLILNDNLEQFQSNSGNPVHFVKKQVKSQGVTYDQLYELVATTEEGRPIYAPTPSLGYDYRGNKYQEYNLNNPQNTPIFSNTEYPDVSLGVRDTRIGDRNIGESDIWKNVENNDDNPMEPNNPDKDC